MKNELVPPTRPRQRIFLVLVWGGRAVGWTLLLVAILGAVQAKFLPGASFTFSILSYFIFCKPRPGCGRLDYRARGTPSLFRPIFVPQLN
jgi:hypothetical protein